MNCGFSIGYLPQANPNDSRGETWQWLSRMEQITICRRRAGSESCHVHEGKDSSKNPERLFLAQGRVRFTFVNEAREKTEIEVHQGAIVTIGPNVVHKTEVIEDAVIIESRSNPFDPSNPDTKPATI